MDIHTHCTCKHEDEKFRLALTIMKKSLHQNYYAKYKYMSYVTEVNMDLILLGILRYLCETKVNLFST